MQKIYFKILQLVITNIEVIRIKTNVFINFFIILGSYYYIGFF